MEQEPFELIRDDSISSDNVSLDPLTLHQEVKIKILLPQSLKVHEDITQYDQWYDPRMQLCPLLNHHEQG